MNGLHSGCSGSRIDSLLASLDPPYISHGYSLLQVAGNAIADGEAPSAAAPIEHVAPALEAPVIENVVPAREAASIEKFIVVPAPLAAPAAAAVKDAAPATVPAPPASAVEPTSAVQMSPEESVAKLRVVVESIAPAPRFCLRRIPLEEVDAMCDWLLHLCSEFNGHGWDDK